MPARLCVHVPEDAALVRAVDDGSHLTLGRSPDCGLVVEHPSVSRHHARLEHEDGAWHIRDLGSKNGVRVDGARVDVASLRSGQWFSIGDVFCQFDLVGEADLANAGATAATRRRNSRLWAERVGEARNAQALAGDLIRAIVDLAECQRGFLLVGTGASGLSVRSSFGIDPDELSRGRFTGSSGAIERALRQRRAVFLNNAQDYGWLKGRASVIARGLRAIVAVPLEHEGRLLGAAYADSDDAGKLFTELDAEILSAFAEQAALVVAASALDDALLRMQTSVAIDAAGAASVAPAVHWTSLAAATGTPHGRHDPE